MAANATAAVRDEIRRLVSDLPRSTELWLGGSGASEVSAGVARDGLWVLRDLAEFERHVARLGPDEPIEHVLWRKAR